MKCPPETNTERLRAHYARTAFSRMGISFERAMASKTVRIVLEGAMKEDQRRAAVMLDARDAA